jgi:hypothetical protein
VTDPWDQVGRPVQPDVWSRLGRPVDPARPAPGGGQVPVRPDIFEAAQRIGRRAVGGPTPEEAIGIASGIGGQVVSEVPVRQPYDRALEWLLPVRRNARGGLQVRGPSEGGSPFDGSNIAEQVANQVWRVDEQMDRRLGSIMAGGATVAGAVTGSEGAYGAADTLRAPALAPVPGATTWETVRENPSAGNVLTYALEQGVGSLPDMAAVIGAPVLYTAARAGDIGQQRADNNQSGNASLGDVATAAPAAILSTLLERFATQRLLGPASGGLIPSTLQAGAREAGQEFLQSGVEYTGATLGTDRGWDPATALDQSIAGAVAGGPFGMGANVGIRGYRNLTGRVGAPADPTDPNDMTAAPLDVTGGLDVAGILDSAGLSLSNFSSPEAAADAANRIVSARTRPSFNDIGSAEAARQDGLREGIAAGEESVANAPRQPSRTPPPDTTIIAFPEGNARSDDAGGILGMLRTRAANESVVEEAESQADEDPLIQTILDANVDQQTRIRALYDILNRRRAQPLEPEETTAPDVPPVPDIPWRAPTVEEARRGAGIGSRPQPQPRPQEGGEQSGSSPRLQVMARIRRSESSGNDRAENPQPGQSASGRYQFIRSTFVGLHRQVFGGNMSDGERWQQRFDGRVQDRLMHAAMDGYEATFRRANVPITPGNLYLAHFLGPERAARVLRNPSAPIGSMLSAEEIRVNPVLRNMRTVGEIAQWTARAMGGRAPAFAPDEGRPYRMGTEANTPDSPLSERSTEFNGMTDAATPPNRGDGAQRGWENTEAPTSPTLGELEAGRTNAGRPVSDQPMGTGTSDRPFRGVADDPEGQPGFWEDRSRRMWEEQRAARMAEMEAEWLRREEMRRQAEGERANSRTGRTRMEEERVRDDRYPSSRYKRYDQRAAKAGAGWRVTEDGFIAGKDGNPVAFRNHKEAARWAVDNDLAGDFDLDNWGEGSRIVLRRRKTSSYGVDPAPAPQPAPDIERTAPPAGRSADTSQRLLGAPPDANAAPPPPDSGQGPNGAPGPSPAPDGPVSPNPGASPLVAGQTGGGTANAPADFEGLPTAENPPPPDAPPPVTGQRFDRYRPPPLPEQPTQKPRGIRSNLVSWLEDETSRSGVRYRISAEDAMSYGVPGDMIFNRPNPKNRKSPYRTIRADAGRIFATTKAPLNSRAKEVKIISMDKAAQMMSRADFGLSDPNEDSYDRMSPSELGDLIASDMAGDPAAWDRSDPRYEAWEEYELRWKEDGEFFARYGEDGHLLPDEVLDAIDEGYFEEMEAYEEEMERLYGNRDREAGDETDSRAEYRPAEGGDQPGPEAAAGSVDPVQPERPEGSEGRGQPGDQVGELGGQLDAFGERPGDQRRSLERRAEGRDRSNAQQKPPGSDGGLFDNNSEQKKLSLRAQAEGLGAARKAGLSIADALRRIATTSKNVLARGLAERLARLNEGVTLDVDPALADRGEATLEDGKVGAKVRDAADEEAVLHEGIHTATLARYGELVDGKETGDPAVDRELRELEALRTRASKAARFGKPSETVKYALSSTDEFLAHGLTSPEFQAFLARHKTANLWGRFVDRVRGLLGLPPKYGSLLDRTLQSGARLLAAMEKGGARPADGATRLGMRDGSGKDVPGIVNRIVDADGLKRDAAAIRSAIGNPISTAKSLLKPMRDVISAGFFTNDARLRGLADHFSSQALRDYADLWHARSGKGDGTGRTYHEAVQREAITRSQRMFEALEPHLGNDAAVNRIVNLLRFPKKASLATAAEREAAGKLRDLLKETIEYRQAAGEDIGEVSDGYFPRVLDVDAVMAGQDKFLRAAEQLYRAEGVKDPAAAAKQWLARIYDEYAGLDGGLEFARNSTGGIGANTAKSREFGKRADGLLADFYQKDAFGTLASYFTGAAKRAEYARRFGRKGAQGSKERAAWVAKHGPDKTQYDVLIDRAKEEVQASGKDAAGVLHTVGAIHSSNLGQLGSPSPRFRVAVSYLHTWNQLAKMDRTTITSLGELTMGFIRGGPRYGFSFVKDSVQEFARQLRKADPSDAARWSEAVAVTNDALVNQVLTSRISAEHVTARNAKILAGFYKGIGLHQFTNATRTAAVKMGRNLLDTWAADLESPNARVRKRAEQYLRELGVSDVAAFGKAVRDGGFTPEQVLADKGLAGEYGTALLRLTNQTIMMPSRAEKPTWAAHPVGSLVFSLMSYSYGFKKNVLDRSARMGKQAVAEGDPTLLLPAMGLLILIAFQGLNDTFLRPFLFGSSYDFDSETPTEAAMRIIDRSGVTGGFSPILNAIKGVRYDRSLAESLSGPVVGTMAQAGNRLIEPFTNRNSRNTNTAERNAAAAIYDAVLDPVIDGIAAARLRGAARTAAILGTGNREGGVAPSDRAAFVDAFGGEEEE